MEMYLFLFSKFMFLIGIISYIMNRKHLLCMLLSLEYIMLSLFMVMYIYLIYMNYELYFLLFYLIFSVCEGVLGLSILVSLVRTHGNDYFQSCNLL